MSRRLSTVSSLVLGAAMSSCVGVRQLMPPPDAGARSILVVFGTGGDAVVYAADVTTTLAGALPPFSGHGYAPKILVLEYGCPLSALGLAPGLQSLTRLTQARPTSLPPPLAGFDANGEGAWRRLEPTDAGVKALLNKIRPERQLDCPRVDRFEVPGAISSAVGLKDGSVLATTRAGTFFRVSRDEGTRPLPRVRVGFGGQILLDGHRTDATVWLVGILGEVVRGTIEEEVFAPYTGVSFFAGRFWLSGSGGQAPLELYRFADRGQLDRLVGTSTIWENASPAPDVFIQHFELGGVAWIAEGEAVAVGGYRVVHYRQGAAFERLRPLSDPEFTAVASIPGAGVLIGDATGSVYRLDGDALTPFPLGIGARADGVVGFAPLGKGFLIVTRNHADYHQDGLRPCLDAPITARDVVRRMGLPSVAAALETSAVVFFSAPDESLFRGCSG